MSDTRVDKTGLDDEDRLPWLEAVEEDDDKDGPGAAKLIAFVVIGLVAIGLIVGGLSWMGNRETVTASVEPEVIPAPAGDYKTKPEEAGGMKVAGEGDISAAASAGADPKGSLDVNKVPEAPVARQQPVQQPAQKAETKAAAPKAAPEPAVKETPKADAPAAAPAAGGATVQLGAFSSQASANSAWKAMSARFKYLAPLTQSVTTTTNGGKTLYRLRASGPGAAELCGRLRVAGESCVVLD